MKSIQKLKHGYQDKIPQVVIPLRREFSSIVTGQQRVNTKA